MYISFHNFGDKTVILCVVGYLFLQQSIERKKMFTLHKKFENIYAVRMRFFCTSSLVLCSFYYRKITVSQLLKWYRSGEILFICLSVKCVQTLSTSLSKKKHDQNKIWMEKYYNFVFVVSDQNDSSIFNDIPQTSFERQKSIAW